jgi:4-hydroxy-tetrahydrodipicolinate synthase
MSRKVMSGVHAALFTPRFEDGRLDESSLWKNVEFLIERGIRGFVVNGATGEFPLTTAEELRRVLGLLSKILQGRAEFACGIGAAGIHRSLENAKMAIDAGAKALLLPMPYFFPYEQEDLSVFCRELAMKLPAPILLYNLPKFTTGLESATVRSLIAECPNIVGIKDSSGSLDILQDLTGVGIDACRMVGSDAVLAEALERGLCDGVISGVACVLPELILSIYGQASLPDHVGFRQSAHALEEFLRWAGGFPVPWALKFIAESRGIIPAVFSQPLSAQRQQQARAMQKWFRSWRSTVAIA